MQSMLPSCLDCFAPPAMTTQRSFHVSPSPPPPSRSPPRRLAADGKTHRIAIQVDQNDPAVMNMVLNNATNVIEYYRGKGEDVDVEIVAYGPGMHMLRADTSPVQDRIKHLKEMVSRQDPVLGLQQHQAGHGEGRGSRDPDRAGGDHRALGRGAADGIAGAGLELRAAVRRGYLRRDILIRETKTV